MGKDGAAVDCAIALLPTVGMLRMLLRLLPISNCILTQLPL